MSAVEEIQQAIATLERLSLAGTPEPWSVEVDENGGTSVTGSGFSWKTYEPETLLVAEDITPEDADLIVTLHRAIDPMLGVLDDALSMYQNPTPAFIGYEEQVIHHQLMLARAINGGAS